MRKNHLYVIAAVAIALAVPSTTIQAQPTNAPGAMNPGNPGMRRFNPGARLFSVRNSIGSLDRVMADLKRSTNDFDGHRETAIDACAKAKEELMAVAKSAGIPIPPTRMPGQRPMGVPPPGAAAPVQPAASPQ